MATRDLKFHKFIVKLDAKYTTKQVNTIKDCLNSESIKFQLVNPFIVHPFPPANVDQIPYIILFLARQMQEVSIKNLNLTYLQHFVADHLDDLVKVLSEKYIHCQLFCLAFIQCLQEYTKSKEINLYMNKSRIHPFIDLFSALLQKRKGSNINKPIKAEEKELSHQIHTIFNALLIASSMKYVKQPDEQELEQSKFLERSLNVACLVAQEAQNEMEWEVTREYLSITSYLLIFNGLAMRPIKLLDFCLDNNQSLYFGKEHNQEVKFSLVQKYLRSLSQYSKIDASYQAILLKIIKNLLTLNINNSMLITHFEILLELIRGKQFPLLKRQIFDILLQSQSKRNMAVIDQIFLCILGSGIDLLDDQVQRFTLSLAETGDNKRKEQFTTIYYFNYEQSFNMIHHDVVNFILEVYLDQNMPLEKVQFMVSNEAMVIKSNVIQKLHSIINERKSSIHLTLLNIILEKRRDPSFKESNKTSISPFVCEEWLQSCNGNVEVYKMYLKILTETLCGKTLDIYPALINLSSCNVKIQAKYFIRSLEFYSIILKAAQKCDTFDENVFRYMVLLQAIFGHKLSARSYSYFSKNFSKVIQPQSTFLMFLQYLTMLLKNKSAVLLYLQAVLEFEMNLNELFYEKNLFDISFLARLIEESQYFRLSTYSLESVTVLYELSLIIKNKHFQEDFEKIIKCWSRIMNRAECKNLTYFFAFREIKKIYPFMKQRQMKTPSDRIQMVWDLILSLIDYKDEPKEYISMSPNDLVITWKGEDNTKKELKVEGCIIRNQNMDLTWSIIIETSSQKTYIISINYDRIVVQVCYTKQENNIIKEMKELLKDILRTQLKKRPENVKFQLRLESNAKKILFSFSILEKQIQAMFFEGNVQHIKIVCKDNAILKDIKITDLTNPGELTDIKQHSQFINLWQIKIASLLKYRAENFSEKFDFTHAYCCIGQMLRHFNHINLPFAYDIFVRLSIKLMKCLNKTEIPIMLQMMVQVFNTVEESYSTLRGRNRALKPTFEKIEFKMYPRELYYFFTSALLPLPFWDNFSQQTKDELVKILKEQLSYSSFREIENNKLQLFDKSLEISRQQECFFQICKIIIETHDKNDMLTIKFKRLIFLASQSSIYQKLFSSFLEEILKYLNFSNEHYVNQLALCKFLIFGSECVRQIFHFCKMNSKTDLLHYISQNPSFNVKGQHNSLNLIKELISVISVQERFQVLPWLITEVKQLIFNKRMKLKSVEQNKYDYRVHYLYLQLLLLNRQVKSADQHENEEKEKLTLGLIKILKDDAKQESCKAELQAFFHSSTYMNFLIDITRQIIDKYGNINKVDKKDTIVQIYDVSFDIIMRFEKKNFLQFVIKYRSKCEKDCLLHKALIENEKLKNLRLSHQSILLQYIFEVLLLIEFGRVTSVQQTEQLVLSINYYIEFLFHAFDERTKVSKSLFYNFPKLAGHKEGMADTSRVMRKIRNPAGLHNFLQLRGGVYFKCVAITLKLMKITPNQDYSNLIDYFIFGPKKVKQDRGLFAFVNDLQSKERSTSEIYYLDAIEEHKLYYNKEDFPFNNKNDDMDLTVYIADYFLMSIAEFLYKSATKIDPQLLKKYSQSFSKGISNSKISKEILMPGGEIYQITCYEDIQKLIEKQNDNDCASSPSKTAKKINFTQEPFSMKELDQTGTPNRRSSRRGTVDSTMETKKKIENLQLIKSDEKNWYRNPNSKNIPLYFSEKAKEIRIIELIHTHYVLNCDYFQSQIAPSSKLKQRQDTFVNKYITLLREEKKQISLEGRINIEEKVRKVKKIHPYTSAKPPVFNILQNCLSNIACPITLKITKKEYSIRRFKSQESLNMNYYLTSRKSEQEYTQIIQQQLQKCNEFQRQYSNKMAPGSLSSIAQGQQAYVHQIKQGSYCQWVTREGVFFCVFFIESTRLSLETRMDRPNSDKLWYLKLGTPVENLLHTVIKAEIMPQDVIEIFYRKFNQITNNSLEFYLKNGTSKFLSFYRKEDLTSIIKNIEKLFKGVKIIKDTVKQFEEQKFSEKWTQGLISNFDYLMLLNKYSGRTYNDLNQYFVFPWVLKDYFSDKIDLTNPDIYRDLSKPVGALNPDKLRRYKQKYRNQVQNNERDGERCLYGSHYSTSLFIFYYLVRLEPYSSLHRQMQKGNFDVADRLFNSLSQVWESLMNESNTSDIKECIPEFYYMPAFLRNIAHIQLGQKQCGEDVGDVELPPWAKNAEEFVLTLRAALESDYVSEHLHLWIDLIFGKYQNSQEKNNIFHPFCYSDPEVLTKISHRNHKNLDGIICQISYFGQCPLQLFKKEHKPKKLFVEARNSKSDKGNSESTTSQIVSSEVFLPNIWKITKIYSQNTDFVLQLEHLTKQDKQAIVISANATQQTLKSSTENFIPIKKNEGKASMESKVIANNHQQIYIGKQFLMELDMKFHFEHVQVCDLWISCFGSKGIRIYNWQLEQYWSWEVQEVKEVYLEATRLIFSTPSGKLCFYSFFDGKIQQIVVFKQICDMSMKVICIPRLPSPSRQKNEIHYKVLCIGDSVRLSLISYTFEQTCNATSHNQMATN